MDSHANLFTAKEKENIEFTIHFLKELKKTHYINNDTRLLTLNEIKHIHPIRLLINHFKSAEAFQSGIAKYLALVTAPASQAQSYATINDNIEYAKIRDAAPLAVSPEEIQKYLETKVLETYRSTVVKLQASYQVKNQKSLDFVKQNLEVDFIYPKTVQRDANYKWQWPINQIVGLPLYATTGPSPEASKHFDIDKFFTDIVNHPDIHTIVSLGFFGIDFYNYFALDDKVFKPEGSRLGVEVTCLKRENNTYHLNISYRPDGQSRLSKNVTLYNVPTYDMLPVEFSDADNVSFHNALMSEMKQGKGVLVHCHAGYGRTGQIVAQLAALYEGNAQRFFMDGNKLNKTAIVDFVAHLRHSRPGLILTAQQLLTFLQNTKNYLAQEKILTDELNNNGHNAGSKRRSSADNRLFSPPASASSDNADDKQSSEDPNFKRPKLSD